MIGSLKKPGLTEGVAGDGLEVSHVAGGDLGGGDGPSWLRWTELSSLQPWFLPKEEPEKHDG